ncbi:MAG: hypothetical protein GY851_03440 [bacterium]|nr:hypothetical protein [bacterium]
MPCTTAPHIYPGDLLTIKRAKINNNGTGTFTARALTDWGDAVWVILCDGIISKPFTIKDDDTIEQPFAVDVGVESHYVYAICIGWWGEVPGGALVDLVRAYLEDDTAVALEVEIPHLSTARAAYNDSAQFSSWTLTGLRRFTNCERVENWTTRASLGIVLEDEGSSVYALELYNGAELVASGSRTGNGSITITEDNDSGVSGSVTVAYSADLALTDNAYVVSTWAASFSVYDSSDLLAYKPDDGRANRLMKRIDDLAADSYSIRLKSTSDLGQVSAFGSADAATIGTVAPPPSAVVYATGNWTNTQITVTGGTPAWVASTAYTKREWVTPTGGPASYAYECTTAGTSDATEPASWPTTPGDTQSDGGVTWTCRAEITYAAYDSKLDEPTDADNTYGNKKTAAATGTTVGITLDTLTAAAAGTRRVVVHGILSTIQDPLGSTLEIEYDASGDVVVPGPNVPAAGVNGITARVVTIGYIYDQGDQSATPATVKMWLVAEGASPTWGSPDTSQAIADADAMGRHSGTIAVTAGADGFYTWIVRVADASVNLSSNTTMSDEEWVGTATNAVPTPVVELAG